MRPRADIEDLTGHLRVEAVVRAICPALVLKRQGRELWGLSPFKAERTPSFSINPFKNVWKCWSSGMGGGPVAFVMRHDDCDFKAALDRLRTLGLIDPERPLTDEEKTEERARREKQRRQQRAREIALARQEFEAAVRKMASAVSIWRTALPAEGTDVETYLRGRGIDCDALKRLYGWTVPPALRYVARLPYRWDGADELHPAMVGALALAPGEALTAVHRTYLAPGGHGKAAVKKKKLMLGAAKGALAMLTPLRPRAVIGEGYETTLSAVAVLAKRGVRVCGISAGSLGNMAGGALEMPRRRGERPVPIKLSTRPDPANPGLVLPRGIAELTILADNDGADPAHMRAQIARAVNKFQAAGVLVRVAWPPAGDDFNDLLQRASA